MSRFQAIDRQTEYLFPPSIEDGLPEDPLGRFIVEAMERTNLDKFTRQYAGRGSAAYHPEMLLSLLIYAYATGVFSSRRIEQATHDSVPFRFIAANTHPDHATLSEFRRRFLNEFAGIFVQVLSLAHEMKMLKLGQVSVDGSKIHADASRHSALSYGHIEKLEAQFKQEVKQLIALAEDADQAKIPEGMNLPDEIKRREKRLMQMDQAKQEIEKRAKARYEREKAEYDAKMAERAEKEKTSGKKPRGKVPQAPDPTARAEDQVNLTDEESRIMKCHGGAFEQCFNAQAAVDTQSYLIVAAHVTQASNDKQQVEPMLRQLKALPEHMGKVDQALMDTGYYSERNIELCGKNQIEPYIAVGRDAHHPDAMSRFSEPAPLPEGATRVEKMRHTLKTRAGRAVYAVRKSTVEPVFGIIKSVMGFRQFSVRGLEKTNGEWSLVCLAWNLKRMAKLHSSCVKSG